MDGTVSGVGGVHTEDDGVGVGWFHPLSSRCACVCVATDFHAPLCSCRCPETKNATKKLIRECFRRARFDLKTLMDQISMAEYPETAEIIVGALQSTAPEEIEEEYSDAEVAAFQQGIDQGLKFSLPQDDDGDVVLEELFVACVLVGKISSQQEREYRVSQIVPDDISQACRILEKISAAIVDDMANESANEDKLAMTFSWILKLLTMNGIDEEGSRRLFVDCMESFIVNVVTPDVLIPHCLQALALCWRQDQQSSYGSELLGKLDDQRRNNESIQELVVLRWLTIASLVLDSQPCNDQNAIDPRPYLTHSNPYIRVAAVECLGKVALHDKVHENDKNLLLDIANDEANTLDLRSHAAVVLSDWSLLNESTGMDGTFRDIVFDWMQRKRTPELCTIAYEIAMKQLLTNTVRDSEWICCLVIKFFEPVSDEENEDNIRLQQLLALFFPAMVRINRDAVVGCIQSVLQRQRKKAGVAKTVAYLVETAACVGGNDEEENSSAELLAAVQIASFLSENAGDVSKTLVRSLCKMLDSWDWDIDKELYEHLSILKELLDELLNNDVIEDQTSLAYLQTCFSRLEDVEMEDQVADDEDSDLEQEEEELTDAMKNMHLDETSAHQRTPNVENRLDSCKHQEVDDTSTTLSSSRPRRRLRPSN